MHHRLPFHKSKSSAMRLQQRCTCLWRKDKRHQIFNGLTANMYHLGLGKDIRRKVFQLTNLKFNIIQYQFLKSQYWSFYSRRISTLGYFIVQHISPYSRVSAELTKKKKLGLPNYVLNKSVTEFSCFVVLMLIKYYSNAKLEIISLYSS